MVCPLVDEFDFLAVWFVYCLGVVGFVCGSVGVLVVWCCGLLLGGAVVVLIVSLSGVWFGFLVVLDGV